MPIQVGPGAISAVTGDVSLTGVFVLTAQLKPPGTRVRLVFGGPRSEVRAEGVVKWLRRRPQCCGGAEPVGMGIEFVESDGGRATTVDRGSPRSAARGSDSEDGGSRKTERRSVRRPVGVEPGGVQAITRDISTRGAFVLTSRLQLPGTRVELTLRTVEGSLRAEGHVKWVRTARDSEIRSAPMGMGIEFARPEKMVELLL